MRRYYIIFFEVILSACVFAQSPQKMSYQAVIRDADKKLVTTQVGIKISILQGSETGTVKYVEIQKPTPNENGLVTIEIGGGDPAAFIAIDWSAGPYFIKTETAIASPLTNYTIEGTSQLLSVPYALYAKTAETSNDAVRTTGDQTIAGIKTFIGTINANDKVIINVATPINTTDAANKAYVDVLLDKLLTLQAEIGVKDLDGNSYKAVKIGRQVWMAENLKTTKYNDGTGIPLITDNNAWIILSTPGYCWYNNDEPTYKIKYGALYNWYTINPVDNGNKNVCPIGWHVPTDAEWFTMENYVDPTINDPNIAEWRGTDGGTKIKSTSDWSGGGNGTDNFGFNAKPAGLRGNTTGEFGNFGSNGLWWTNTINSTINNDVWCRYLVTNYTNIYRHPYVKGVGASIRCILD